MRFTWDPRKEVANLAKHGVPFSEAQQAFDDPMAIVAFDEAHSPRGKPELRWWLLGEDWSSRYAGSVHPPSERSYPNHRRWVLGDWRKNL